MTKSELTAASTAIYLGIPLLAAALSWALPTYRIKAVALLGATALPFVLYLLAAWIYFSDRTNPWLDAPLEVARRMLFVAYPVTVVTAVGLTLISHPTRTSESYIRSLLASPLGLLLFAIGSGLAKSLAAAV